MGINIHIPANYIWEVCETHEEQLRDELVLVAENTDNGYSMCATIYSGFPTIVVKSGDDVEYREITVDSADCCATAKDIFRRYLMTPAKKAKEPESKENVEDRDDEPPLSEADALYQREDELLYATRDFLQIVLKDIDDEDFDVESHYGAEFLLEATEELLSFIAKAFCVSIYRPTFIEDEETGCEIYMEYPYEDELPFDSEEDIHADISK